MGKWQGGEDPASRRRIAELTTPPGFRSRRTLNDCRYLMLEADDRRGTTTATCSCGKWTRATDEHDAYRLTMFKIDGLVHEWALRHRAAPTEGAEG